MADGWEPFTNVPAVEMTPVQPIWAMAFSIVETSSASPVIHCTVSCQLQLSGLEGAPRLERDDVGIPALTAARQTPRPTKPYFEFGGFGKLLWQIGCFGFTSLQSSHCY